MERNKITFEVTAEQRKQIESRIKSEYPHLKNVSQLVREALIEFLAEGSNQSGQAPAGM